MAEISAQKLIGLRNDDSLIEHKSVRVGSALELGVVRYFGGKELSDYGRLTGWAAPEQEHNWNDGCETVLQTVLKDPGGPCAIEVQGAPFINDRCPRQDVILHVNGFRIGYWRLTRPSGYTLLARVEREQLFPRGGAMLMKLVWSFPDSVSPSARDLSNDSRELAFCFRSILVSKVGAI